MYNKKYRLIEAENLRERSHSKYNEIKGSICYPAYLKVGERGWILIDVGDTCPHRFYTSVIKDVQYTRDNRIIVLTQNTRYMLEAIQEMTNDNKINLENISTKSLVEELCKREGVETVVVEPYEKTQVEVTGSAIVLFVYD